MHKTSRIEQSFVYIPRYANPLHSSLATKLSEPERDGGHKAASLSGVAKGWLY